jgi:hypothetical protein
MDHAVMLSELNNVALHGVILGFEGGDALGADLFLLAQQSGWFLQLVPWPCPSKTCSNAIFIAIALSDMTLLTVTRVVTAVPYTVATKKYGEIRQLVARGPRVIPKLVPFFLRTQWAMELVVQREYGGYGGKRIREARRKGTRVLAAGVSVLFVCCLSAWFNMNQDASGSKVGLQQYSAPVFQFSGPLVPNGFQPTGAAESGFAGTPAYNLQQLGGYGQVENVLAPGSENLNSNIVFSAPAISSETSVQPKIVYNGEVNAYPQYQYAVAANPVPSTSWYQVSQQPAVSVPPQPTTIWPSFAASVVLPKQVLQQHDINQWLRQKRLAVHSLTGKGLDAPRQSTRLAVQAALISAQAVKAAAAANQTLQEVRGTK